jgi:NhaP-type Na+/H+ or K+/H+ antiporter
MLEHLDISENKIKSLKPDTFNYNRKHLFSLEGIRGSVSAVHCKKLGRN